VTDIAQAAGRALRRHGGTSTATIIVPALLPESYGGPPEPGHGGLWEPVLRSAAAVTAPSPDQPCPMTPTTPGGGR
jgi:hypothetical protein